MYSVIISNIDTGSLICKGGKSKMDEGILSEKAADKRREYQRLWYSKNRDKAKEHSRRYWERKALGEGGVDNDAAADGAKQ